MKKTVLTLTGISAVLAAALRAMQYMFIIDENGVFTASGSAQSVLRHSLTGLLLIFGVFAFVLCFIGKKGELVSERAAVGGKFQAVMLVLLSAVTLYSCGYSVGKMIALSKFDAAAIISALCAAYFAVLAFELFTDRRFAGAVASLFGLFAPVYFVYTAIINFFGSISVATRSSTKLTMLAICFATVYAAFVSSTRAGAGYSLSRAKAFCAFGCVSLATGASEMYPVLCGRAEMHTAAMPITFAILSVMAFVSLVRLYTEPPKTLKDPEADTETEKQDAQNTDGLDVYIDDIPEPEENNTTEGQE